MHSLGPMVDDGCVHGTVDAGKKSVALAWEVGCAGPFERFVIRLIFMRFVSRIVFLRMEMGFVG